MISDEQCELMMQNIVEMGKYSFELEKEREQSLLSTARWMLGVFSFIFTFSGFLPGGISKNCILVLVILGFACCFGVCWRFKYYVMPTVDSISRSVASSPEEYEHQAQFNQLWQYRLERMHKSKISSNNIRLKLILTSFYFALAAVIIAAGGLIWNF